LDAASLHLQLLGDARVHILKDFDEAYVTRPMRRLGRVMS
jgi:hypothetical protein